MTTYTATIAPGTTAKSKVKLLDANTRENLELAINGWLHEARDRGCHSFFVSVDVTYTGRGDGIVPGLLWWASIDYCEP